MAKLFWHWEGIELLDTISLACSCIYRKITIWEFVPPMRRIRWFSDLPCGFVLLNLLRRLVCMTYTMQ